MSLRTRALLLLLLALAACTHARREVEGNISRRIQFEGNGGLFSGHNDLQLRRQMVQESTSRFVTLWPFSYWIEPHELETDRLVRDAYRLEVWYAHHGWFDARVAGWELVHLREQTDERAGVVDVHGYIEPGPPSLVRAFAVDGVPRALDPIVEAARRRAELKVDEQFSLQAVEDARLLMIGQFHDHGRAYATIVPRIDAHPAEHAVDVRFDVDPGIPTRLGPITITGNERIATERIVEALPIEEGDPYKLSDLRYARQVLFEMRTFSLVTVEPDLSDPTREAVPLHIGLTEARFRTVRLGGGFEYDFGVPRPRVTAMFRHVNLLDRLIRFEANASAGVAVLFQGDGANVGLEPTYQLDGVFDWPRVIGRRLSMELHGRITQDLQSGIWMYRQPQGDLSLIWRPSRAIVVRGGPHVEEYRYLTLTEEAEQAARRLFGTGTTFVNPYQLTALDQAVTIDWRDDPLRTTRGSYWALNLREAIPLTEGGFGFGRVIGEARLFRPLRFSKTASDFPLVAAGKLRSTYMVAFDDRGVPYPELAFLGGPSSIRGFRTNQVGPYDTVCSYDPLADDVVRPESGIVDDPVTLFHLPQGGRLAVEGSAELRYPWKWGLLLAGFVDAGLLERDLGDVGVDDLRWSVGVGARYDTIIGPIRLDVSARPLYPEDNGPESFVNCLYDEDAQPRAFDLFSSFEAIREGDARRPPLALVFYFAIGEAL